MRMSAEIAASSLVEHFSNWRAPAIAAPTLLGVKSNRILPAADAAAREAVAAGKTNREVLLAARAASGQKNLTYKPHQSTRETERRRRQVDRAETA